MDISPLCFYNNYNKMMNYSTIRDLLSSYPGVETAYIFGSSVRGHGWKKTPDIDIGILFNEDVRDAEIEGEKIREDLERILKKRIDVISLGDAPPLLRFEVIRNGRSIFERHKEKRVDFEVRSLIEFYDLEPLRRQFVKGIRRLIREGDF